MCLKSSSSALKVSSGKQNAKSKTHLSSGLQVALIADQHDHHVRIAVLSSVLQPGGQVIERVSSGDVVDQQCASSTSVVGTCDRSERLLTGGVPV